jgi:hypothetical protein
MNIDKIMYKGVECLEVSNDTVTLIISLQFGPRVLFYGFTGGQNFFHTFDDQIASATTATEWHSYGGHRLWHAPEVYPRSYYPDNDPVDYCVKEGTLILKSPCETVNGIEKRIEIELTETGSVVRLDHILCNRGVWDIEVSAWCLSVMASGGRAIIPQEHYIPHGHGEGETFEAARSLVLWPFTSMGDPRFIWGEKYIQMREDASHESKQKIGMNNTLGWAAYALKDELFIKRFDYLPTENYPDNGCNCEFFTMPHFLEVETLSPLVRLAPDGVVHHREEWSLAACSVPEDEKSIEEIILPLLK